MKGSPQRVLAGWRGLGKPLRRLMLVTGVYAAVGVGWAAGTLPAGLAGSLSYGLLFMVGAVLGALGVAAAVTIPETRPLRTEVDPAALLTANVWQDRDFVGLGALTFAIWLVGGQLLVTLPLWVVSMLGYPNAFF